MISRITAILVIALTLLGAGCVTGDFKVVDALKVGMTPTEAEQTIASFGFKRTVALSRPEAGWPGERGGSLEQMTGWRAGEQEMNSGIRVSTVELYPVYHGLLGYGELFLFYGENGRLAYFHRHQIN